MLTKGIRASEDLPRPRPEVWTFDTAGLHGWTPERDGPVLDVPWSRIHRVGLATKDSRGTRVDYALWFGLDGGDPLVLAPRTALGRPFGAGRAASRPSSPWCGRCGGSWTTGHDPAARLARVTTVTTDEPSTTTAHDARGGATRRTLLSVLPLTTAWAGAAAVVAVPVVWTIVGAVVEQSPEGLTFIVLLVPVMLFAAIGALLYGFAAGALAALPDWFLRRRSPSAVGAVSSVVILTAVVSATFGASRCSPGCPRLCRCQGGDGWRSWRPRRRPPRARSSRATVGGSGALR